MKIGTLLLGKENNGYSYTNDKSLCVVIDNSIDSYDGNDIKVLIIASSNLPKNQIGRSWEVKATKFEEISLNEYFNLFPDAEKADNFDEIINKYQDLYNEYERIEKEKEKYAYKLTDKEREILLREMMDLLEKYGYEPTEKGCNTILDEWAKNKSYLINLIKNHPNYNGKFQIAFDENFSRELDYKEIIRFCDYIKDNHNIKEYIISKFSYSEVINYINKLKNIVNYGTYLSQYGVFKFNNNDLKFYQDELEKFENYKTEYNRLNFINKIYLCDNKYYLSNDAKNIEDLYNFIYKLEEIKEPFASKDFANYVNRKYPSIKAVKGQKISRIVNKICHLLEIDKNKDYNKMFAKFSDAVNPLDIKRHTVLSCHPIDYFTMSFGNSWSSCHTIDKKNIRGMENGYQGQYSGGTESYMLDNTSVVLYTVDAKYDGNKLELEPKINRNMFHIGQEKIVQGRVYPQCNDGKNIIYGKFRNIVQKIISDCYKKPNLWTLKKGTLECQKVINSFGAHYKDYLNFEECNVSYLKHEDGSINEKYILVGHNPICPCCGKTHNESDCIECEDCY